MLALLLAVMAAAWLVEAADDKENYNVFGTVALIRSGERTPLLRPDTPVLTALGAQQMYELGQNFRTRYINGVDGPSGLGIQNIEGMSLDLLLNDQLFIQTLDKPYMVSSAQAFMQGLYPPYSINSTRTGPLADATGLLANGSAIDFPLGGYQYPDIQAVGELDPQSVYISGTQNCPASNLESALYETTDEFLNTQTAEKSVYQSLDLDWFEGNIPQSDLDYRNAFDIYDYLSYAYMHNTDAYEKLSNDTTYAGVYDRIRYLANTDAWNRWGNTSASDTDDDYNAMAGKTMAALMLGQFQKIVNNGGNTTNGASHPLTLLFGEHQPFVSLFSLMITSYMQSIQGFQAIPPYASALIIELFTQQQDNAFPQDHDSLMVRVSFHNGTEFDGKLQAFPVFGFGPDHTDLTWMEFQDYMSRIMTNQLVNWCEQCNSASLFCWGVDDSTINITLQNNQKYKVTPTVAGVIGAVVTLAVAGLIFAFAMLLGGIRFHRVDRGKKSELGGFKGSAKLASDADLNLPKNGVAPAGIVSFGGDKKGHERVGSWELRQKEFGPGAKSGDLGDESRRASMEAIETAMSRPIEPSERV